jgi:2-dehydropantoate 2-reductase
MGCLFAARLAEAGSDVTLIEVNEVRLAALQADGVTVDDADGVRTIPVAAAPAASLSDVADLIIVFTKGAHTAAAIGSVSHLVGPSTRTLTLQNGLGNAEAIAAVVPADRVLVGVTDIPSDLEGPTRVASHGAGRVWLDAMSREGGEDGVREVVALLRGAGFDAVHDRHVQGTIWEKIAFNAAMNALCTVTMLPVGGLDNPPGRRLITAISDEVLAVAWACGVEADRESVIGKLENALAHHVHHKPSMLQDRLAGRATEIETINGAVVRAGAAAGVATPINMTMADLVRAVTASHAS